MLLTSGILMKQILLKIHANLKIVTQVILDMILV